MKTLSGVCMAYLVLQQTAWWEAVLGVVFLATFGKQIYRALFVRGVMDWQCGQVRAKAEKSVHIDCRDAKIAFLALKRG